MVTLYSTNCPKCKALENKLYKFIDFDIVTDNSEIVKVAKQYNLKTAPILVVNGVAYNYEDAMKMISNNDKVLG